MTTQTDAAQIAALTERVRVLEAVCAAWIAYDMGADDEPESAFEMMLAYDTAVSKTRTAMKGSDHAD